VAGAVVASPVGEYKVVREGVDGLLAYTERDWYAALKKLIDDEAYRRELASTGRKRVEAEFNWTNPSCREPWREAIRELVARSES
jgi:glycosyltransferase involved in cell wall biosynthesis